MKRNVLAFLPFAAKTAIVGRQLHGTRADASPATGISDQPGPGQGGMKIFARLKAWLTGDRLAKDPNCGDRGGRLHPRPWSEFERKLVATAITRTMRRTNF